MGEEKKGRAQDRALPDEEASVVHKELFLSVSESATPILWPWRTFMRALPTSTWPWSCEEGCWRAGQKG